MREEPQKQERKITDINLPRILEDFFAINNDFISEIGSDRCECCGSGQHRADPKTKMNKLAINLNYEEAEEIKILPENTLLVSINFPNCLELNKLNIDRNDERVLTIFLHDIPIIPSKCTDQMMKENKPELEKFLKFYIKNRHKDFLIHCAMGKSRSAALCLFLKLVGLYKLKDNFLLTTYPNPCILQQILKMYYTRPNGLAKNI